MKCLLILKSSLQSRSYSSGSGWTSHHVRSTFISFFQDHHHVLVPSSPVVPRKAEGTYFTNAGMVQFKPVILGELDPRHRFSNLSRAVNSQKCIRVGGKHNDLEDVGLDFTHHTFFEMLGNWSFGDYFKEEACHMALELLTRHYGLSLDRLYFTYFGGDASLNLSADNECRRIWLSLGIPEARVLPFGVKDNFWDMGLTGPCGPCTEIHYDHTGGRLDSTTVNSGSPELVEIWNIVFMQYCRLADQSLRPLNKFHVDTGMGLERLTAILNNTRDNYCTDLFLPLLGVIHKHSGCPPYCSDTQRINTSYRILADHARMFTVAISDGLLPAAHGLGHKLRSILHRSIRLCQDVFHVRPELLLPDLVSTTAQTLINFYPVLETDVQKVQGVVCKTIELYHKQREQATHSFDKMLSKLGNSQVIPAEVMLDLEKGLYGSPMSLEVMREVAEVRGLSLDMAAYHKVQPTKLTNQQAPVLPTKDPAIDLVKDMIAKHIPPTNDDFKYKYPYHGGYDFAGTKNDLGLSTVRGMTSEGQLVSNLQSGQTGQLILDLTSFYAEGGGQQSDTGLLKSKTGEFYVADAQHVQGYVVHYGQVLTGYLEVGQEVEALISEQDRIGCMCNHTATHLLHAALSNLEPSVQQRGSSVTPHKLTFDFYCSTPLNSQSLQLIEATVKEMIKEKLQVSRRVMPLEQALQLPGVKTLQSEEYPAQVSIITVANLDADQVVSSELCAGTHVFNTSHIGEFCITNLTTKSQNIKRLTCVTGLTAKQALAQGQVLLAMCDLLHTLVQNRQATSHQLDTLTSLTLSVASLLGHRAPESHVFPKSTSSRQSQTKLEDIKAENQKAQGIFSVVRDLAEQLKRGSLENEDVMKHLVTSIRKVSSLELMPRSTREEAHKLVELLEHKVTEALNRRCTALLIQEVETKMKELCEINYVCAHIDHININPRHLVKVATQAAWNCPVLLVHKPSDCVQLVVSLPLNFSQPFSQEDSQAWRQVLQSLGTVRGQQADQKNQVAVYSWTVQTQAGSMDVLDRLNESRLLDRLRERQMLER